MVNRRYVALGLGSLGLALGLAYAARAVADGIPASKALSYAGVLENGTGPLSGDHNIQVYFYDAASGGNVLCQTTTATVSVQNGHFSVPLPDACTTAVAGRPDAWVTVLVDGSDTGRAKIGAVPYAVEANHATSATTATALAGVLPVAGGGTGSATQNFVDLTTTQSIGGAKTFTSNLVVTGPANGGVGRLRIGGAKNNIILGADNQGYELDLVGGIPDGTLSDGASMGGHIFLGGPTRGDAAKNAIVFAQNGAERMRIADGGNIGIGLNAPTARLEVAGNDASPLSSGIQITSPGYPQLLLRASTAAANSKIWRLISRSDGTAQLQTLTDAYGGEVTVIGMSRAGAVSIPNGLSVTGGCTGCGAPSDASLKTDVRPLERALADLARLRGVRFHWRKDGTPSVGVIAQEVEKVFPELVITSPAGTKSVEYGQLTAVLIEATKELDAKNRELDAKNRELEARLERLERLVGARK